LYSYSVPCFWHFSRNGEQDVEFAGAPPPGNSQEDSSSSFETSGINYGLPFYILSEGLLKFAIFIFHSGKKYKKLYKIIKLI